MRIFKICPHCKKQLFLFHNIEWAALFAKDEFEEHKEENQSVNTKPLREPHGYESTIYPIEHRVNDLNALLTFLVMLSQSHGNSLGSDFDYGSSDSEYNRDVAYVLDWDKVRAERARIYVSYDDSEKLKISDMLAQFKRAFCAWMEPSAYTSFQKNYETKKKKPDDFDNPDEDLPLGVKPDKGEKTIKGWFEAKNIPQSIHDFLLAPGGVPADDPNTNAVFDPNKPWKLNDLMKEYSKYRKYNDGKNWTGIHADFDPTTTIGIQAKYNWIRKGFDYDKTKDWINIGLGIRDAGFCKWLQDEKHMTAESTLNTGNLSQLQQEYTIWKSNHIMFD